MDTTGRLLRHMRWANQQVYSAVASLPDEALEAYIVNPDWPAKQILQHVVRASRRYRSLLWPDEAWEDVPMPTNMAQVRELAAALDESDARLVAAAALPDGSAQRRRWDGELASFEYLTVLSQSVHHATEHRAQLLDALNARGFEPVSLDSLDLWSFEGIDR